MSDEPGEEQERFTPRNYQVELMKIGLEKNTIIFLPTGAGKTFIALMILRQMSEDLLKPYCAGGKISVILVNTVALVDQHAKYIQVHTPLTVGCYTGEMNLDFWPREKWYDEFNKYQVIIMTSQILVNLVQQQFMDLNKVNLIIFDECHRGVSDHSMRQLMKSFQGLYAPPRVIGLTATLLNGNCKPERVMQEVLSLETTYHSKVATVDGLEHVVGYSTNPKEKIKVYRKHNSTNDELVVINHLENLVKIVESINIASSTTTPLLNLKVLNKDEGLKKLKNLILDQIEHIKMMGTFGGIKALSAHMIQIERLKKHCQDVELLNVLLFVFTTFAYVKEIFNNSMKTYSEREKIMKFSSDKVLTLFEAIKEFKNESQEEICALIFVKRRVSAKIIHHILQALSQSDPEYSYMKTNFVVGNNNNPYNDTRESLFLSKKNKQVLESFSHKEFNILNASNVLEEGVDIPKCTLVIKFDKPEEYRSYIQSKGRARHKSSYYYMLVEEGDLHGFINKYKQFQEVEKTLNNYLIGKNTMRQEPSLHAINEMYKEDYLPPYYVNGPGSAHVTMTSAIALLCQYCQSLPSDEYTSYAPDWYLQEKVMEVHKKYSVVILLPTICPYIEKIIGPYMSNIKLAKRAAALEACKKLHKIGELDDHLLPRKNVVEEEDISYLFSHYPAIKEKDAGNTKKKRVHKKKIPLYLHNQIRSEDDVYLHVINLEPKFNRSLDLNQAPIFDAYDSQRCFGLISKNPLLSVCDFPVYVSQGCIDVSIKVNKQKLSINQEDLQEVKNFHYFIFNDLLNILKPFLIFDKTEDAEMLLLVPINKKSVKVDFAVMRQHKFIQNMYMEPSVAEKTSLELTRENYINKIVSPWYRRDSSIYIVTEVCFNKNPLSQFPNEDFENFMDYYKDKHHLTILNKHQPLLLVRGLSKRLNMFKPRGVVGKRKRNKIYEEVEEYLIPELLIKQDFPSDLWIQGSLLPTILSRFSYLLRLEDLRSKIASESGIGQAIIFSPKPLEIDEHCKEYEPEPEKTQTVAMDTVNNAGTLALLSNISMHFYNKDFCAKKLEEEYPWKNIEEPKDIERELDITLMDIEYYEQFVGTSVKSAERLLKNESPTKQNLLPALTYHKDYVEKAISLLDNKSCKDGPALKDIYRALTTAKANDIVNLERLETLGDSFLKLLSSLYLVFRFPTYDEGRLTSIKNRLVSNRNLYYLAVTKNLTGYLKNHDVQPKDEGWLPPGFTLPQEIVTRVSNKELSIHSLFDFNFSVAEQITGTLDHESLEQIRSMEYPVEKNEESSYNSMSQFLKSQYVGDKFVADVVESLLGAYFESNGFLGGVKFIEWMGIIPTQEKLLLLLNSAPPNPIMNKSATLANITHHIPLHTKLETALGYTFRNKAYLLQALTHPSYTPNRITQSYERLEFLGDSILDFLITCHIYESCGKLSPGELTDLRSALVNNNTFASLTVRCGFHKHLLMMNSKLQGFIDKFVDYLASKNYEVDDEVLILLEDQDMKLAEYVDVPKVLGDLFESLAGAVYLDSGKDLKTVWKVFYKIMFKEINLFSQKVPKNVVRRLYECSGTYPEFGKATEVSANTVMVSLRFMCNGTRKLVHGFGSNKIMAKKAAAKIALRSLEI